MATCQPSQRNILTACSLWWYDLQVSIRIKLVGPSMCGT